LSAGRLYIISREHAVLYDVLQAALAEDPEATVVLDRRTRATPPQQGPWERERRLAEVVDDDIRYYGWAVVNVEGPKD
jgi:hypothetical protein